MKMEIDISDQMQEITEYLSKAAGVVFSHEQVESMLSTKPDLVFDIWEWDGIDDISLTNELLDLVSQRFLGRDWPSVDERDLINIDEFRFDLRTRAAMEGLKLMKDGAIIPDYKIHD